MLKSVSIWLFIALLTSGWASHVRASEAPYTEVLLDPTYREEAERAKQHLIDSRERWQLPSLSAAVAVEGQLVWAGAVGWADVERQVPATPDTRYRIGSTSKAVTATLMARLADRGSFDLDQPIGTYAESLPNPAWPSLTPRQLMSHTAGIVGYDENRDLIGLWRSIREDRRYDTVRSALDMFDGNPLLFAPGEGFHYSTFDVVLASYALEEATGKPYPTLLQEEITKGLGATGLTTDDPDGTLPNLAIHYRTFSEQRARPWRRVDHSYKWAGGGLVARSQDLVILGSAWLDPSRISTKTRDDFWTPVTLSDGQVNPQSYAVGFRVHEQRQLFGPESPIKNAHHAGVSKGANSWFNIYPDLGVAIAINSNIRLEDFQDFIRLEYPLTRIFVGEKGARKDDADR